jgi:hypothetical protein
MCNIRIQVQLPNWCGEEGQLSRIRVCWVVRLGWVFIRQMAWTSSVEVNVYAELQMLMDAAPIY